MPTCTDQQVFHPDKGEKVPAQRREMPYLLFKSSCRKPLIMYVRVQAHSGPMPQRKGFKSELHSLLCVDRQPSFLMFNSTSSQIFIDRECACRCPDENLRSRCITNRNMEWRESDCECLCSPPQSFADCKSGLRRDAESNCRWDK